MLWQINRTYNNSKVSEISEISWSGNASVINSCSMPKKGGKSTLEASIEPYPRHLALTAGYSSYFLLNYQLNYFPLNYHFFLVIK